MKIWTLPGIAFLLLVGCNRGGRHASFADQAEGNSYTAYASGFEVVEREHFKLIKVHDPWQNSSNVTFSYVLAEESNLVPDSLSDALFIKTPVRRVITLSTTHVAMIGQLGMEETIVGASGTGFIFNPEIRRRINEGSLQEVGYDQGLSYETIVTLEPDVLFMYGVEGSERAISEKLGELGVPVVFCGDYLEPHPLGKAEWIRFFALFYGMEKESDLFFLQIDSTYRALSARASECSDRPRVLTGLPWKDTWYMAGGNSFAARLIEDAGGAYLWSDNSSGEAVPLDLESVFARAVDAEVWINPGAAENMADLNRFDERFSALDVVKKGRVYNNNKRISARGGNDYWESGTLRPDLVLADLIYVFHPDLLTDHELFYYMKLK